MKEDEITPEHTCFRVGQVLEELESLRQEMGRMRDARVPIQVRDASPREVFYHARTVHRKANQLCVESGGNSIEPPSAAQPARARAADVLRVLDSVRERLATARSLLNIEGDTFKADLAAPVQRDLGKQAADTMTGCLIASRQLNVMLLRPFASQEGQERMLRALAICELLLGLHGIKLPDAPPYERRKFARDVFLVLYDVAQELYQMMRESGLTILEITKGFVAEEPTDVHDIASLLVSELEYVLSFLPVKEPPLMSPWTMKMVLPAHNFRRARQLQEAIRLLATAARARPDWLKKEKN